jgi:hypothetical protein
MSRRRGYVLLIISALRKEEILMTCYQWLMKLSNSQAGENNWRKSKSCVLELTYEQVDYSQNHFSKHS